MKLQLTDPVAAMKKWAEVDHAVVDKAPLVSLFNPKKVSFTSKHVGHFVFNPVFMFLPTLASVK